MKLNDLTFQMIKAFDQGAQERDSVLVIILRDEGEEGVASQAATKFTCGEHLAGAVICLLQECLRSAREAGDEILAEDVGKVYAFTQEAFGDIETVTEKRKKYAIDGDGERVELAGDKRKLN